MLSRPIDFLGQATAASWDFQLTNSFEQRIFSDDSTLVKRFLEKLELTLHFTLKTVLILLGVKTPPLLDEKMPPPQRSSYSGCLQEKSVLTASQRPCRGATWIPQRALCQSWPKHQLNGGKVGKSFGWMFVSTVSKWWPYLPCLNLCQGVFYSIHSDALGAKWWRRGGATREHHKDSGLTEK